MRLYLIASTPYDYLHHRFQKLADGFRALGVPVTYVEQSYGWRAYLSGRRRGLVRAVRSAAVLHRRALSGGPVHPGGRDAVPAGEFEVLELPLVIPTNRMSSGRLERWNASVYRTALLEAVARQGREETAAIVDNPLWGAAMRKGDFTRLYYDCIDDVALYAGRASLGRFLQYERNLVSAADAVFATAAKLEERLLALRPPGPVHRLPNGVEYEWFQHQASRTATPDDIRSVPRPVVGYMGSIADWMDYEAVQGTARLLPQVSFVFVGPVDYPRRVRTLERSPNVYWLGKKAYRDVPAYVAAFDVCWIPFLQGRIVEHTNPIKLYEYFALGKPVVTTPLAEAERFVAEGLASCGTDAPSLARAVESALMDGSDAHRARRMEVARSHSWKNVVARMHRIITTGHD